MAVWPYRTGYGAALRRHRLSIFDTRLFSPLQPSFSPPTPYPPNRTPFLHTSILLFSFSFFLLCFLFFSSWAFILRIIKSGDVLQEWLWAPACDLPGLLDDARLWLSPSRDGEEPFKGSPGLLNTPSAQPSPAAVATEGDLPRVMPEISRCLPLSSPSAPCQPPCCTGPSPERRQNTPSL